MIAIIAAIPLLLFNLSPFKKRELIWVPTLLSLGALLYEFYQWGANSSFSLTVYKSFLISLSFYLIYVIFDRREVPNAGGKLFCVLLGLLLENKGLITGYDLLVPLWLIFFRPNKKGAIDSLINFGLPLLYLGSKQWINVYLGGPSYFKNLDELVSNYHVIWTLLTLVILIFLICTTLFIKSLKNFVDVGGMKNFIEVTFSMMLLFSLKEHFPDFINQINFTALLLSALLLFRSNNYVVKVYTLVTLSLIILGGVGHLVALFLPLLTPLVLTKYSRWLRDLPEVRYFPMAVTAVVVPLIITGNRELVVQLSLLSVLVGSTFGALSITENLQRGVK